ncbi:MAG TPA: multicopper oxidase domain-containing protein [Pyrinomonadaceae bacterium]|nr:multicopper oxidase domain-containing protein [Pyrinomonadaceae bacterium]
MAKISKTRQKELRAARKNRQEIAAAGLSRRELFKMGLITSAGYLIPKRGLSARALSSAGYRDGCEESPPTTPFLEPLPTHTNGGMVLNTTVGSFGECFPPPVAPCPSPREGRRAPHQALARFPPQKLYEVHQRRTLKSVHPQLPLQPLWGFGRAIDPPDVAWVPGPTYREDYNVPVLVRNFNELPANNDGFGRNQVTTHQHNGHTPSESDGFPCDYYNSGKFYDQHYPNVLAGFDSTHPPTGDINESMSTLWYHDHRVDFTAQNTYKGLAGFYLLFNQFDTGNEESGFRLPSFPEFDIPLMLTDRVFDRETKLLCFDLFELDGILGDKFLVNGKIQPFFNVQPRRYRFRILDAGPSRFYQLFLTNLQNLNAQNGFWQISNDGNLLPRPIPVTSLKLGVAERADIIVDFSQYAGQTLYLENRLIQDDGRGPRNELFPPGQGNLIMKIVVAPGVAPDLSAHPSTQAFYALPSTADPPRVTRVFRFDRTNGQWAINNRLMDPTCEEVRFRVLRGRVGVPSVEHWILQNNSGGWSHPIHIHFEEFQILERNGVPIPDNSVEKSRKDVVRLGPNETVKLFFRFRDFGGRYPMHCHNTVHEDHAMMLRFDIVDQGADTIREP